MPKKSKTCPTCTCGPLEFIWMIVAAIVMAIGVYVIVMAINMQWSGGMFINVAAWYALGFIILGFGKMAKWKSAGCCPAHAKV